MLNKTNNTKNSISNKYSKIIKGLENIFEKIKKELVKKKELSQDNFKVWEEKNQHLVHGFAWIATYIESLRQINNWGIELANKNKLIGLFCKIASEKIIGAISGLPQGP